MPTLPAIDVTQAQYDRLVAALPGTLAAEKQESYTALVINALIDFVERTEIHKIESAVITQRADAITNVQATMPPRLPFPPNFSTPQKGD